MPATEIMMSNTQNIANLVGQPCKADGWYGNEGGLHTIAVQVFNFTGRIYLEASLALVPGDSDWFPVSIGQTTPYLQFPINPTLPTGSIETGGDTGTQGVTFKLNAVWLRAKLDRTYLNLPYLDQDLTTLAGLGIVDKITLAR